MVVVGGHRVVVVVVVVVMIGVVNQRSDAYCEVDAVAG